MNGGVLAALLVLAFIIASRTVSRIPPEPEAAIMARQAARDGSHFGDVAIIIHARSGAVIVACSCAEQHLLFAGDLTDCRTFASEYNEETRRMWDRDIPLDRKASGR